MRMTPYEAAEAIRDKIPANLEQVAKDRPSQNFIREVCQILGQNPANPAVFAKVKAELEKAGVDHGAVEEYPKMASEEGADGKRVPVLDTAGQPVIFANAQEEQDFKSQRDAGQAVPADDDARRPAKDNAAEVAEPSADKPSKP